MTDAEILRNALSNPLSQRAAIYAVLDRLGVRYTKTGCPKCLRDYIAIGLEELGEIDSAAEMSGFDGQAKKPAKMKRIFRKKREEMRLPFDFQPVNAVSKVYADMGVPMPAGIDDEPIDDGSGSDDIDDGSGDGSGD